MSECDCKEVHKVLNGNGQEYHRCIKCGVYYDEDGQCYVDLPEINEEPME